MRPFMYLREYASMNSPPTARHNRKAYDCLESIIAGPSELHETISRIAENLRTAYRLSQSITVIVLLDGAKRFADDLFRILQDPRFERHEIKVTSYQGTSSTGTVRIEREIGPVVTGRDVLIVDDIYDTGLTLFHTQAIIRSCGVKSLKTCVLFEKNRQHAYTVPVEFIGMKVPDRFLIGYGLDYNGQFRELDCLGIFKDQ